MTENDWSPLSRFGWGVERASITSENKVALAQILFKERGPVSVGYIPRGPVIPTGESALATELMRNVDLASKRRHALYTILEADGKLP